MRANPAGNITLFVLDPVDKEQRGALAARLMALPGSDVEQVGFVCPPLQGGMARMEMAGGEFCGNASRAFGMLTARERGGLSQVRVEVSGCEHPVTVDVDWAAGTAQTQMPLPRSVRRETVDGCPCVLVDLGGIAHLVAEDIAPGLDFFRRSEPLLAGIPGLDAYGVIFLDSQKGTMTPLVKVPDAGSLVWEGSCGSGSLAAALAQSQSAPDGPFVRDYIQPAGVVQAAVVRRDQRVTAAYIGGAASVDQPAAIPLSSLQ
ncbi:hypothetical protein D1646_21410 [Pseudoflavonifractor sp. 60]|nr:hypothetical protein [Pseudoflavonifractor sp. 60]